MKLNKFLSLIAVAIIAFSISGCNKPVEPIVLTGRWQLDSISTFLLIQYNPSYKEQYPTAYQYLVNNKERILKEIKKPEKIEFIQPNVVNFIFKSPLTPSLSGTFTQYQIYVTITNTLFPLGITGASNNQKLEIYYGKEYMMGILNSMLTPSDDAPENFELLIDKFDGVGVYTKSLQ
jgi:hypothetical protein